VTIPTVVRTIITTEVELLLTEANRWHRKARKAGLILVARFTVAVVFLLMTL
jgi:hypothetical protein